MNYLTASIGLLITFSINHAILAQAQTPTNIEIEIADPNFPEAYFLEELLGSSNLSSNALSQQISNKIITENDLQKINAQKISDIIDFDTSISESYSAIGYTDSISIRGISLNSQNNYLRNGLPFLTDAPVHLENKTRIEVIKGTYGILNGMGSPGGIINYVTKLNLPSYQKYKENQTEIQKNLNLKIFQIQSKSELNSNGQFGTNLRISKNRDINADAHDPAESKLSYDLNLSGTQLQTTLQNSTGKKYLAGLQLNYNITPKLNIEADIEHSYQSQASQPGMSLWGSNLPPVISSKTNLNNQTWSKPVEFTNLIGSLKLNYFLSPKTNLTWSALGQNILTNDRVAFPFGCTTEGNYDRYCSDGTFDMYDYRSENEKRKNHVFQFKLNHQFEILNTKHSTTAIFQNRTVTENFDQQAYNYVGIGHVTNPIELNENASLTEENTNKKMNLKSLP